MCWFCSKTYLIIYVVAMAEGKRFNKGKNKMSAFSIILRQMDIHKQLEDG